MNALVTPQAGRKTGFRDLKVVAKTRESSIITSFDLEPVEPEGWRAFQPGQFLVFRVPAAGGNDTVLRNYSVSCSPAREGSYRITVKREAAPRPDVPNGLSSCYLHDTIEVGDVLVAEGPRGEFVLDRTSTRPVVLLSGGVGLTPMVSMLHALATESDRPTYFIHACENGDVHALRAEVETLAAFRPGISAHFCYRSPTEQDKANKRYHSEGVVTRELLQSLLPLDDYEVYLCGPPPFMQALYQTLRGLGIEKNRIAYEFFGPATVLEQATAPVPVAAPPVSDKKIASNAITVEFRKSGLTVAWDEKAGSLLDFAEAQGLSPDFSCRAGICSTCKSHLVEGAVAYFEDPLDELAANEVLLCCSKPQGPVVIDI
jgi:ferredoxin-NADP reductase